MFRPDWRHMIHIKRTRFGLPDEVNCPASALRALHRRRPAAGAAVSLPGQLPLYRVSVVSVLLAGPALFAPVELDVGPPEVALPDDELPDPVLPYPELPDVAAGVLPLMFRQGM